MMSDNSSTTNNINPFSSLDALRDAHRVLLKQYREKEITPAVAEEIEGFIRRGRATGALLENEEDRWDGQTRLDYWVAILQRAGYTPPDATLSAFEPSIELAQVIQRVAVGEPTEDDIQLLRNTLTHSVGRGTIQLGKYNINLGQGQEIHIGNRLLTPQTEQLSVQLGKYNVNIGQGQAIQIGDRIYQDADAEAIRKVLLQLLEARNFRTLLTHAEFSDRVEQVALTSYRVPLLGRDTNLQDIQQSLASDHRIIVLHGAAGLGKTRLLLALSDITSDEQSLWYVRNEAESIEPELASLDINKQHIIVVDDAHRFGLLYQLREVLVSPKFAGKVTLVLATRSTFKDSILYQLDIPIDQAVSIEITTLGNSDIDKILQDSPYDLTNQDLRHAIVRVAEGNPLIAGMAARLSQRGVALANLTRDQVLTKYLNDIIRDLSATEDSERDSYLLYIRYLQVLAALGTVNLSEEELIAKIHDVIVSSPISKERGFTLLDEERIVTRLVETGLVERYWKTLKISSEVLADHILFQHFFNPKTKQADYQKLIIEPFFNLKPREVLTSLAEAEFKRESPEAGLLLTQKLNELRRALSQEGNLFRFNLLHSLREVAYLKPDDILALVATIVDSPEPPPETIQDKFLGGYTVSHDWVLSEAVDLLERTIYQGGIKDAIVYLHKLAMYQANLKDYERVREKARKALIGIAEFKPRKPYTVQFLILNRISDWLEQDFLSNLSLSLALIQPILNIDLHSAETHPIQPRTIVVHQGSLEIGESLRQIRDRALEILYAAYRKVQDLPTRRRIVEVISGATYHTNPRDRISSQTQEQLQSDCAKIAHFFSETVIPSAEFPILDRVVEWLWQAKNFHQYQAQELDYLQEQLRNHRGYQLYRLLVGSYRWDDEDERLDWRTAEQQKQQKINEYVEALSSSTLEQAIQELEAITKQARSVGKNDTFGLNNLLRIFGQTHLNLAQQFIAQTIAKNLNLKQHLGFVLAGIRLSDREIARGYVYSWVAQDDSVLWVAIAQSYRFIDWSQPQLDEEWDVLRQLVAKQCSLVDLTLFWPIQQLAPHKADLAVELLKTLAARGDEPILRQVAETVSWQIGNNDEWAVTFKTPQDLLKIIQNFERLSYLDYRAEQCLKRLADITPMQVIDFIEHRIKARPERHQRDGYFEAFPKPFSRAFDDIKGKPEYPNILRRVRNWMLQDNFLLRLEAPALLKGLALNLEGELYSILMEWVESRDADKLKAVANILREFNSGQSFYDLSREIIVRTQDENVLSSIQAAIGTTPGAIRGRMSNFTKQRIQEVSPWLKDENLRVRLFAQQEVQALQRDLEREEAQERLEERSW